MTKNSFVIKFCEKLENIRNKKLDIGDAMLLCDGEPQKESLYIMFTRCAPLPCNIQDRIMSYCNSAEYAANYMQMVLMFETLAAFVIDDEEYGAYVGKVCTDEDTIKEVFRMCEDREYYFVGALKEIYYRLEEVKEESDEVIACKMLKEIADMYNQFMQHCNRGWDFFIDVFDGIEEAGRVITGSLSFSGCDDDEPSLEKCLENIISTDSWNDDDRTLLKKVIAIFM